MSNKEEEIRNEILNNMEIFDFPEEVSNPYSGESAMLEPEAVAVYDFIKGTEMLHSAILSKMDKVSEEEREHVNSELNRMLTKMYIMLDYFRKKWPNEYYVLLD